MAKVKFDSGADNFMTGLKAEVDEYFKENSLERKGDSSLYWKAAIMTIVFLVPFISIMVFEAGLFMVLVLSTISGFGMAGVGMNVMHDANHKTFHRENWVNELIANLAAVFLPAFAYNWRNQHNIAHHSHTNIDGFDQDLESVGTLRLSKEQEWKPFHRFQYLYAPILYSLTILMRVGNEFGRLSRHFREHPNIKRRDKLRLWSALISGKVFYFAFWIALPVIFGATDWYLSVLFFVWMHMVCGLVLTLIFQTAHVVPKAQTYSGEESLQSFALHQVSTTCNFAIDSKLVAWLLGGLNFQIEHHLFPYICHVHYPAISRILKRRCEERGVEYKEYKTLLRALQAHFVLLRALGLGPKEPSFEEAKAA